MSDKGAQRWTQEQRCAIEIRDRDTLVSAGAGSGKTSVLVERVIRRLLDPARPVDVDRILVVTFTESAAAEMRERIRSALIDAQRGEQARRATAQLGLIGKATISTLHGFCLQMLRRHFYVLGLDPRFTVAGEDESRLLKLGALDRVFESMHQETEEGDDSLWRPLVDHYGGPRDDQALREIVLQLFEYVQSLPEGEAWLARTAEAYHAGTEAAEHFRAAWQAALCSAAARGVEQALSYMSAAESLASLEDGPQTYLKSFGAASVSLTQVHEALRALDWDRAVKAFRGVDWPRLVSPKNADQAVQAEARSFWDDAKKVVRRWSDGVFTRSLSECVNEVDGLRSVVVAVCNLVRQFSEVYRHAKRRQGLVDFSDLERLALDVLTTDGGRHAEEYQLRFEEVMVDEYQDINPVQDRLLSLLARSEAKRGNRFLVGDVKQSIYRFRLADPTIFQEKFHGFGNGEAAGSARIDLQANFRSKPHILQSVNFLFRQLMHQGTGGIHYGPDAFLRSGIPKPEHDSQGEMPEETEGAVHLHLIELMADDASGTAEHAAIEREAALVGNLINSLVPSSYRFKDVAILMRSPKGRAGVFVEVLEKMGIPAHTRAGTGFFKAVEVDVVMSLLRLLDNVRQDIPLAAVLRSPIVGITSEELARIRALDGQGDFFDAVVKAAEQKGTLGERLALFLRTLDAWRTSVRRLPLSQMLRRLYDETGYLDFVAGLPRAEQREANLWGLYHRAQQFDHFRTEGLDRFLRFVDDLEDAGEEIAPPPTLGEGEDVVQVMSVHQSKGLEFPVVILVDLDRGFNRTDTQRSLIFHRDLGIGTAVVDRTRHVRYPSIAHRAVAEQLNQDTLEEELRLFYVAATRAKERMVWVAGVRDLAKRCGRWAQSTRGTGWHLPAGDVMSASSWLDWIGRVLVRHRDGRALRAEGAGDLGADFYEPVDHEVWSDSACFNVTLWSGRAVDEWLAHDAAGAQRGVALPIDAIGHRESIESEVSDDVRHEFERRFAWCYPSQTGDAPAKISVTEFARIVAVSEDVESLARGEHLVDLRPAPSFESGKVKRRLTAAERGSAVHRLLALGNFCEDMEVVQVEHEVRRLVDAELLSPQEGEVVDAGAIARFFATPLGRRVASAIHSSRESRGERLWRELPFTMLQSVGILDENAGDASDISGVPNGGEGVVVQGTVDCLLSDGRRHALIDYKTDFVTPGDEEHVAERYRLQLKLYSEFVRRAFAGDANDAVIEAFLVFLTTGRIVSVEV